MTEVSGTPRALLAAAVVLPLVLVVGVVVATLVVGSQGPGPLPVATIPAEQAGSQPCAQLLAALPGELDAGDAGELDRRTLLDPAPEGVAAWGDPAVVLRCGLGRPAELTPTSRLLDVSGVQFLELTAPGLTSWIAVDREVYVALTVPSGPGSALGSGPLQSVAEAIGASLPVRAVDVGELPS